MSLDNHQPVCLPRLGLSSLLVLRCRLGKSITVYFDQYTVPTRLLIRYCRIPAQRLVGVYQRICGVRLQKTLRSKGFLGSPTATLRGQEISTDIINELRDDMAASPWTEALGRLIGPAEALAFYHKVFPQTAIWPPIWGAILCRPSVHEEQTLLLAAYADWPREWREIAQRHLNGLNIELFSWPPWYCWLTDLIARWHWTLQPLLAVLSRLPLRLRYGRVRKSDSAMLVVELIDGSRLGGGPSDTNYVEDGGRIKRSDVCYFLTRKQARLLDKNGRHSRKVVREARGRGFRVLELWRLAPSLATLREVLLGSLVTFLRMDRLGPACLGYSYSRGVSEFLVHVALFDNCRFDTFLQTANPDGPTGVRLNSAVITGLCRRYDVLSFGYQNRCIYSRVYEDSFDCYDAYLSWGDAWRRVLGKGNDFIGEFIVVGCLHNEGLIHGPRPSVAEDLHSPVIGVFTAELGGNHAPESTSRNLLLTCMKLARKHPECQFRVKTKDPEMAEILLAEPEFRAVWQSVRDNFQFLKLDRFDCGSVIEASDIVIAHAFTTPGSDALLLGRRVIFYSEMNGGGEVFAGLPDLIASSEEELMSLFETALADYGQYAFRHESVLRGLDPFRDGQTRSRIVSLLGSASGLARKSL